MNKVVMRLINAIILLLMCIILMPIFSYANTYSNNSISIDISTIRRTYDHADDVEVSINIENKNRYATLHYKIKNIYTGGGFNTLGQIDSYKVLEAFKSSELVIPMRDRFINVSKNVSIGRHAYGLTEDEYTEFKKYRNEKLSSTEIHKDEVSKRGKGIELAPAKAAKGFILAFIVVILLGVIVVIFLVLIIKFRQRRDGYMSIVLIFSLTLSLIVNLLLSSRNIYASDTYQENTIYTKNVSTRCTYANFDCTFDVEIEYYFVNTIAPITDLELDTDSDTLPDYLEVLYLTDLNNPDTDSDGIPDGIEVYKTYTDPLREDTDNNGISDADEDYDEDGLTNKEEVTYNTDPSSIDTDNDTLSDYDEINTYSTDPSIDDTDSDTLLDGIEIKLGLNPNDPSDFDTKVEQEYTNVGRELNEDASIPISFYGKVAGYMPDNVKVRLSYDDYYNNMDAVVGNPIIIDTTYDAGLKIKCDLSKYKSIAERLQLCKNRNGTLIPVENSWLTDNILYGVVESGEYVIVDSKVILQEANIFF